MPDFAVPQAFDPTYWLKPCSVADINRVENALGVTLPEDYKAFLLKNNAVSFRDVFAKTSNKNCPFLEVGMLHGVNPANELVGHDLRREQMGYDFPLRVPKGIVKIGEVVSGYHAICLSTRQEDYGVVYYWNPGIPWEERVEDDVPTMRYLTRIADSFTALWNTLEVRSESNEL